MMAVREVGDHEQVEPMTAVSLILPIGNILPADEGTGRTKRSGPIRLLLAEHQPVVRQGLRSTLAREPAIGVVGEAASGVACIELARELAPDVVLADLEIPDMSGFDLILRLRAAVPASEVVAFSVHAEETHFLKAMKAGAAGYVTKDCSQVLLINALKAAAQGGVFVEKALLSGLVERLTRLPLLEYAAVQPLLKQLTPREVDVLRLLAQGRTNREISESLCLAHITVKKHVAKIAEKIGVADRTQAALIGACAFGIL